VAEKKLPNPPEDQKKSAARDQAAGASAYVEAAAADNSEINLDDLMGSPAGQNPPAVGQPAGLPGLDAAVPPPPAAPGKPQGPAEAQSAPASDFPQEALDSPTATLPPLETEEKKEAKKHTAIIMAVLTALQWIWARIRLIPPFEDIFDYFLSALGLQRRPSSMLRRANALAGQGRLAEAIQWYRNILSLRPLSVPAYDGLGRVYFRMGLTEESNREFTIADSLERLLHNRDDIEAAAALAQAFLDRKQAKIAVSMIEPVLVAQFYTPGNSELLKTMGRVYGELRANKKMYQVYQAGLAQYPNDYEFFILKGEAEKRQGNLSEGDRLIRWGQLMKKLKENPSDAQAKMAMGELCLKENRLEEGLHALKEAAALQPQNTGIRWRLFNLYQKQSQPEESLKYLLEIVALEPDNEDLQYRLADFYRKNKQKEAALDIYRKLADKRPREPQPRVLMGEMLSEMGNFEEGQRMTELAQILTCGLKANPDHRDTVRFMKYLFSIGQYEEGIQWLERGLVKWPYHGELVLTKVKMLYNEYRYKEAVALLKSLIAIKSDMAEPHIWVAMCYQRMGDNMAALAESQLATRLAPKSYVAHKVLGDILKEQKKLSQANAAYEVAEMMRHGQH
jgi:tetratricopeptide (TPR) repeat protein